MAVAGHRDRQAARRRARSPVSSRRALETEGIISGDARRSDRGDQAHEQALALAIQINGKDATIVARDEQLLGATLARAGEWSRATVHYQRALALIQAMLGPDHPDVALLLSGLASCSHYTGDTEARARHSAARSRSASACSARTARC